MKKLIHVLLVFMLVLGCGQQHTASIKITGNPPAMTAPVEVQLANNTPGADVLEGFVNNGAPLVLQKAPALFSSPDGTDMSFGYCAIMPDNILSQDVKIGTSKKGPVFEFQEGANGKLDLLEDGKPVFSYNFGMQLPEGVEPDRKRSSYVYPIYDLNGINVFDDFPADHYHHRGLSWMWPKMIAGQDTISTWDIQGVHQVFEKWLGKHVGPVCATFGVKNSWQLKDRQIVDEYVWLRVFKASDIGRVIDISLTFISSEPVEFQPKDFKAYGGLCLRFAPRKEVKIHSPEGFVDQDILRKNWVWADQSALHRDSDKVSGVTVFQHKDNPNYPADWILRHYGFTGVSWPGLNELTFEPNVPVNLKFRIWIHNGGVEEGKVAEAYRLFSEPPTLSLQK